MDKLLHTLLNLAHFLCNVYIAIRYTCIAAYRKCTDLWCATTELDVLLRAKTKKVPRHLVIVLGLCDESVLDCVRIIGWCITLNIPYISFFDRNGNETIWYQFICFSICVAKKRSPFISYVYVCMRLCWRSMYLSYAIKNDKTLISKHETLAYSESFCYYLGTVKFLLCCDFYIELFHTLFHTFFSKELDCMQL